MKNMVVSMILLLATSAAFAQSSTTTVCTLKGHKSVNEIRIEGSTLTMTVDGDPMPSNVESDSALNLQAVSRIVGEQATEAHQYVITAPQGTGTPQNRDTIQLVTGVSGNAYMILPRFGVVASSQACQ